MLLGIVAVPSDGVAASPSSRCDAAGAVPIDGTMTMRALKFPPPKPAARVTPSR